MSCKCDKGITPGQCIAAILGLALSTWMLIWQCHAIKTTDARLVQIENRLGFVPRRDPLPTPIRMYVEFIDRTMYREGAK